MTIPLVAGLGTTELLIILGVLILLFGAKKLPELARGSGRALRIFKAETKDLVGDDDDDRSEAQREIDQRAVREREQREAEERRLAAERPVPPAETRPADTDR